ncbi:MAG TPA: histidine phosphatase family protein [Dehalococcoidia bacterium]|nr:histidine phosphatase family protein [Dehalococcoidia bacterium]
MRLFLVRHCEPDSPPGWAVNEAGLTEVGRRQAEATAGHLLHWAEHGHPFTTLFSSPARRAIETAEAIAVHVGLPVQVDAAYAGAFGPPKRPKLAGRPWDSEVEALLTEIQTRAWDAVTRHVEASDEHAASIIVSHDTTLGALICAALGMPVEGMRRFRVDLGSVSILDFTPRGVRLGLLNETRQLEATS